MRPDTDALAAFLSGFVAGEGSFSGASDRSRYVFEVGLGASDREMCGLLRGFLGVGHIYDSPRRKPHHDDDCNFSVTALPHLLNEVVHFMDEHLPASYKREQYLAWRGRLMDYWEHRAKRVRPCTVDGCETPRRAHGLCRHHLFKEYRM